MITLNKPNTNKRAKPENWEGKIIEVLREASEPLFLKEIVDRITAKYGNKIIIDRWGLEKTTHTLDGVKVALSVSPKISKVLVKRNEVPVFRGNARVKYKYFLTRNSI